MSEPHAGLISPLLTIAGELARRGVPGLWFASSDDRQADVESIPGASPVRFVSVGPAEPALSPASWDDETYARVNSPSRVGSFLAFLNEAVRRTHSEGRYEQTLAAIDKIRPALIVVDVHSQSGLDAAMTRGVPYVVNIATPVSYVFPGKVPLRYPAALSGLPLRMTPRQHAANLLFKLAQAAALLQPSHAARNIAFFRRRQAQGIKNPMAIPSVYAEAAAAVIGNSVFGIEYPFPNVPEHLSMLGTMVPVMRQDTAPYQDLFDWLDAHESVVYIGLGTMMRTSRRQTDAIVEAVARVGPDRHVLWTMPLSQQDRLPAELPPNLRIESWVPQTEIVAHPHVRVFLTHGGNGAHHGLYFGKPLLVLPHSWETRDLAVRLVEGGATLMVDDVRGVTADELVDKLSRLTGDATFARSAAQWQRRLRDAGGVSAAADLILRTRAG
ncbi:glycosyltransferase [Plantactinospora sp. ZYX-F-223]|uniref:glycosyltransferase n=1 Tax=Plantactinospora sp. ZYX-F-223 TaxID=3144103 RepID=UPI0031FC6921